MLTSRFFKKLILSATIAISGVTVTQAQDFALKSNVLSDAFANINLGAEVGLAPKWSLELTGDFNAWKFDNGKRWKHWVAMPEARYWFCDRFDGHFLGAHLIGGQFNVGGISGLHKFLGTDFSKLKDYRYQGWMGGAGIAYGYDWILGKHWNIEAEIGIGWIYTKFDKFRCIGCSQKLESGKTHNYYGPTKAAVNVMYIF